MRPYSTMVLVVNGRVDARPSLCGRGASDEVLGKLRLLVNPRGFLRAPVVGALSFVQGL